MIRFMRIGRKNQPSFKIVVTEKAKSSTGGRFVEEVGFYNPVTKEKVIQAERIRYWISQGAQPTPTASNLFISEKVIEGKKAPKHKKSKKKEETKPSRSETSPDLPAEASAEEGGGSLTSAKINQESAETPVAQTSPNPTPEQPSQASPEEGK
ncbi:MAG: 30S ribosomal protein S16 [Candidatus Wildermuthbacteria bacterium RIFCSPHIGHO2_02_FULL_47_12]|uniref:30S ribosomal protein S16 n=2 Tax=Parcubacteria group TaxID=1794811 RepID=A0A1G2R3D9_9BACT|nr:MAG: 30S ribosomal protein S16 [Candidatus Buchananbacteria bacterium RIFCSPLOWO2_01_FULL_46_12]OHA66601.1 MAG: 30S ribosomal protein S16 [Candidatus Wildermuthbacteria bacterium RIFCSPHIGHO2_02_FULL_47_12]